MISRRGFLAGAAATAAAAALPMPPALAEPEVMSGTAIRQMFMSCAPRVRPMAGDQYVLWVRPWVLEALRAAHSDVVEGYERAGVRIMETGVISDGRG